MAPWHWKTCTFTRKVLARQVCVTHHWRPNQEGIVVLCLFPRAARKLDWQLIADEIRMIVKCWISYPNNNDNSLCFHAVFNLDSEQRKEKQKPVAYSMWDAFSLAENKGERVRVSRGAALTMAHWCCRQRKDQGGQWFSAEGDFVPCGTLGNGCRHWGSYYWHFRDVAKHLLIHRTV